MPSPEQACPRPYQGVRVKDPVKELLQRKRRADLSNSRITPTAVVVPNTVLSSHHQVGASGFVGGGVSEVPAVENGAFCTGWIAQAAPAPLQPMAHWPCQETQSLDPSGLAQAPDMYVQPMCPSYTVVGPSSMLAYTHAPLFANFGARTTTPTSLPQVELPVDGSVTYIPWTQPLATVSTPTVQCTPVAGPFSAPQLLPLPMPVPLAFPEPDSLQLEQARAAVASLPLESLLEEDHDGDTILHIYAAKEMRAHVCAAAERLRRLHRVCRIDAKEHHGKTPLLVAVTTNQPDIASDLIRLGADVNAADNQGQTALHMAAKYGYPEVIQVLVSAASTLDLEVFDFEGHSPLHCAVLSHNRLHSETQRALKMRVGSVEQLEKVCVESVEQLEKVCVESVEQLEKVCVESVEQLEKVCVESVEELEKVCVESVEQLEKVCVGSVGQLEKGRVGRVEQLEKGRVGSVEQLEKGKRKVMDCIMLLLQAGSCLYTQDIKSSKSVLHLAVQAGNYSLLRFFLEVNTAPDFINMKAHGHTALHMAAALHAGSQQEAMVRLLLAHGADPSLRNLDNEQPAHLLPPGTAGEMIRGLLRRARGLSPQAHRPSHQSSRECDTP
ncbi:NF-kappa-B inhibitor zeta-like isoform X2 [Conger conger]|uniref:NF-kappa-B inhibitor zeta-like isoform X2 n=1 Tax=Conger conger TaxID=82655 RepID=UPI002A5A8C91|nr:NF-kappa-B inhibitor zeta-like isoform X2 [Conger conger]